MRRSELKIGQRVRVVPNHTNLDKPAPDENLMYVRELHNKTTAGLSRTPDSEHIYGILYGIIYPLRPKSYNMTDLIHFHNFANENKNKDKKPMELIKEYEILNPELSPKQKLVNMAKALKVNNLYKALTGKDIKGFKDNKAKAKKPIKFKHDIEKEKLLEEAKKRGFKKGVSYIMGGDEYKIKGDLFVREMYKVGMGTDYDAFDYFVINHNGSNGYVYNGKTKNWAKIIKKK